MLLKAVLLIAVVALATAEHRRHHHHKNSHREADDVARAYDEAYAEAKQLHQRYEERLRMKIEDILLEAARKQLIKRELRLRQDDANDTAPQKLASGELTDPDEANNDIKKLVKHTHENLEKKADKEIVISKGMTKNLVKNNGQVAKKMVKESEDKKSNGEEIVDKEANLEIDRAPGIDDPVDPLEEKTRAEAQAGKNYEKAREDSEDSKTSSSTMTTWRVVTLVAAAALTAAIAA